MNIGQLTIAEVGVLLGVVSAISGVGAGLAANKLSLRFFGAGLAETKESLKAVAAKHEKDMERFSRRLYCEDGTTIFVPRAECLVCKKFSETQFQELKVLIAERQGFGDAQLLKIAEHIATVLKEEGVKGA